MQGSDKSPQWGPPPATHLLPQLVDDVLLLRLQSVLQINLLLGQLERVRATGGGGTGDTQ